MSDSIANGGCCSGSVRPGTYGDATDVAQITVDKCGRITKISNVAISGSGGSSQWTGTTGNPIYYVPNVGIGSSSTPTSKLQVTGNVYVSNAITTTNVFAATETLTGTTGQTTLNVTGNIYASNALTTPNVHVTDTLDVVGSMTANAANATFFFDTFTIPYINTQYLNVASTITVTNNLYVSNTLTTTNIFAATETLTGTSGQTTLNVTGNLYASNALTTTNITCAGFTSNISNTIFNYDTLTIPFINSTTLNVASTSNLQTIILVGASGQTTLNVTGNLNASNALTTTNIFAATETLTGTAGRTTSTITGNLNASNALTTTNIFAATETLTGTAGRTTSTITGNLYASNALTTTNIFSATETLTGTAGRTTSTITGNLYISNALTTTNVFATTVSAANPIPFRNRIINGAMNIWQRNTAAISTTTSVYTTADRWCGALGTSGLILSQWPGPIEAPQFPYAFQVITSTTTTGVPLVEQRIENQTIPDFLNGTPVSVSFWVGQSYGTLMPLTVGLYYATAVNNFGTQTLAVAATQNTPTLTTANAYYSLSFTLTTSLGATNGLSLRFTTGGASAIGSTFFLTGVQVEKGATATPFEVRPYSTELALAQRYYYQITSPTAAVQGSAAVYAIFGTATGITTTAFWLPIQFPVPMRTPNYTFSNSAVTNFQLLPTGTTTITGIGVQSDSYTPVSATLNFVGTNIVPTASYIFRTNNLTGSTTAFFGFSCEV